MAGGAQYVMTDVLDLLMQDWPATSLDTVHTLVMGLLYP